jgi:heme/copper-type cytochrome/quinol oxidase subunit 3
MSAEVKRAAAVAGGGAHAPRANGWWGMVLLIITELALIGVVVASYFYLRFRDGGPWPPQGIDEPRVSVALVMTLAIVAAGGGAWLASRRSESERSPLLPLLATVLFALCFLGLQALEWKDTAAELAPSSGSYASLFYTISGLHAAHVIVGVLIACWAAAGLRVARLREGSRSAIGVTTVFWTFMVGLWLVVFLTLYVSPRL